MLLLSICIITKNEDKKLKKCLSSLCSFFEVDKDVEIVVVDTGSDDNSIETAKKAGAKVFCFTWENDFSKARNFAISKASNNWILMVDTDEYLEYVDKNELNRFMMADGKRLGMVQRNNHFVTDGQERIGNEWIPRLFSRVYFHYEGRIHEQLVKKECADVDYKRSQLPLRLDHNGYLLNKEDIEKKATRNIELLLQEEAILEKENVSDEKKAYIKYQLGKSYYFKQDYSLAAQYLEQGLSYDLNEHLDFVIDMVVSYGYALINSGQEKEAMCLEGVYDTFSDDADFLFVMGLIYMKNGKFECSLSSFERATYLNISRIEGVNGYLSWYNMGVIYECLGDYAKACELYLKCGNYEPAKRNYTFCRSKE